MVSRHQRSQRRYLPLVVVLGGPIAEVDEHIVVAYRANTLPLHPPLLGMIVMTIDTEELIVTDVDDAMMIIAARAMYQTAERNTIDADTHLLHRRHRHHVAYLVVEVAVEATMTCIVIRRGLWSIIIINNTLIIITPMMTTDTVAVDTLANPIRLTCPIHIWIHTQIPIALEQLFTVIAHMHMMVKKNIFDTDPRIAHQKATRNKRTC